MITHWVRYDEAPYVVEWILFPSEFLLYHQAEITQMCPIPYQEIPNACRHEYLTLLKPEHLDQNQLFRSDKKAQKSAHRGMSEEGICCSISSTRAFLTEPIPLY